MEERWREPAALAEQYAGMLYRLAYARTGSRADAEDVMQEVFVRLLRARPEIRDDKLILVIVTPVFHFIPNRSRCYIAII